MCFPVTHLETILTNKKAFVHSIAVSSMAEIGTQTLSPSTSIRRSYLSCETGWDRQPCLLWVSLLYLLIRLVQCHPMSQNKSRALEKLMETSLLINIITRSVHLFNDMEMGPMTWLPYFSASIMMPLYVFDNNNWTWWLAVSSANYRSLNRMTIAAWVTFGVENKLETYCVLWIESIRISLCSGT